MRQLHGTRKIMAALVSRASGVVVFLGLFIGLACGCRTTARKDSREAAKQTAYWKPHHLLTSDARYRRLYVEIDTVEGCAPDAAEVAAIKSFLERHCRKPDGIYMAIDDQISRDAAQGKRSRALVLEHMDGPPDEHSAFLYFLFFDSALSSEKKSQPNCTLSPFPGAIFIDHQYVKPSLTRPKDFLRRILLHETAHALGLCRKPSHSDGLHCTNTDCLMQPALVFRFSRWLLGRDPLQQKDFCEACKADMVANVNASPPQNLRFHGRYFVREETDYTVISQPSLIYLHVGPLSQLNEDDLAALRAAALKRAQEAGGTTFSSATMDRQVAVRVSAAAAQDPVKSVRNLAQRLRARLDATRDEPAQEEDGSPKPEK